MQATITQTTPRIAIDTNAVRAIAPAKISLAVVAFGLLVKKVFTLT